MKTIYQFKPQSRLKGNAQKVGEAIESLRESAGTVSPASVVHLATPKDSVLHPYFEWNDKRAGAAYRAQQAGHLLRSLVTIRATPDGTDAPTRAFVSVARAAEENDDDSGGTYTSIDEAVRVVDYREQLIRNALRDLDAYRLRYQLLADLTSWGKSIARAREALQTTIDALASRDDAPPRRNKAQSSDSAGDQAHAP